MNIKKLTIAIGAALVLTGCGMDVDHDIDADANIPQDYQVRVGPDFVGAMAVCDNRYGKGTKKSEECFQDYKDYLNSKVTVGLDLDSIEEFCKRNYAAEEVSACLDELSEVLAGLAESVQTDEELAETVQTDEELVKTVQD